MYLPAFSAVAKELAAAGRRAIHAVFDVADPTAVRAGVAQVVQALGPVDVLVNNAGLVANIAKVAARIERFLSDGETSNPGGAGRWRQVPGYDAHCCGLARSVRAEETQDLALLYVESDIP